MSGVDLVILAGLAFFLVRGLLNGFVGELAPMVGLAAGATAALRFAGDAARWAAGEWSWAAGLAPGLLAALAGAAVFLLAYAACRLGALVLAGRREPGSAPGGVARLAGGMLGLAKGALVVGFVLLGTTWLLAGPVARRLLESSVLARELARLSSSILTWAHAWL